MPEYIDRKKIHYTWWKKQDGTFTDGVTLQSVIDNMPIADVVKVKHGEWIEYSIPNIICCSECDWGTSVDEKFFKYCPHCGTKMDLKEGIDNA